MHDIKGQRAASKEQASILQVSEQRPGYNTSEQARKEASQITGEGSEGDRYSMVDEVAKACERESMRWLSI